MGRYRLGRQHQLFQNLLEVANEVAPLILDLQIDVTICTFLGEPKATQVAVTQDIPRYPKISQDIPRVPSTSKHFHQSYSSYSSYRYMHRLDVLMDRLGNNFCVSYTSIPALIPEVPAIIFFVALQPSGAVPQAW
jgi:hypothetical protein